jgi:hypothetical protein
VTAVLVRGSASPEEVAALVAALAVRSRRGQVSRYEQWRQRRLTAIGGDHRPNG